MITQAKNAVLNAATVYYEYLASNNLGCEQLQILQLQIDENILNFFIKTRFLNPDTLMLEIKQHYLALNDKDGFNILFYNEKLGLLTVECLDSMLLEQIIAYKDSVKLFSDLKFLILNLKDFFEESNYLALPKTHKFPIQQRIYQKQNVAPTQESNIESNISSSQDSSTNEVYTPPSYLNQEQQEALYTVLSCPFSYVWGAPGSGKTQVVLFEALLYYIYRDMRVCVLAPTNSALEQVMCTLIKKFDALGLNREKILRLGTPSNVFLENFIEVYDPQILQAKQPQSLFSTVSLKTRLKEALVVGMTIDGFIKRYKTIDIEFVHFFLDECAFTPLIKALTLTTQKAPITLLGDHKQLMPICEIPPAKIKGEYIWANLFNLSALFLEEFFAAPQIDSAPIFHKTQCSALHFKHTTLSILRKTHRYGDNLAKILDTHIYQNGLKGRQEPTGLYYIDCPNAAIQDKSNQTEAQTIAHIFPALESIYKDIAVITPFVQQRKLISAYGVPYRYVWTIHSSQGQEFDCVVFSPVMLHHYLTNSHNKNAAHALNVAISRIKQQLIIVCDYHYWIKFKGQFLSEILHCAKPYPLDTIKIQYSKQDNATSLNNRQTSRSLFVATPSQTIQI